MPSLCLSLRSLSFRSILFAALAASVLPAWSQSAGDAKPVVTPRPTCSSVVVVHCDPAPPAPVGTAEQSRAARERADAAQRDAQRRLSAADADPNRTIVYVEQFKPMTVEESIASVGTSSPLTPGTHTIDTPDRGRCTCINNCPGWFTNCCQCSVPRPGMSNFSLF
jgi:hypothetical protein